MNANMTEDAAKTAADGKRERSTVEFPYMGLEDAVSVAKGIHSIVGSGICQHDQLAAALEMSMNSSGYRMRLSAARVFGVADPVSGGMKLTDLGHKIVDSAHEREAKARAFLNVELFKKLYDLYRGKMLPPASALEREMANLGVAQKQTERARQVFQRSAEIAGFFEMDRAKLIMPAGVVDTAPTEEKKEPEKKIGNGGPGGGSDLHLDPLLIALLKKIPTDPTAGWPGASRVRWFRTFAMNVSQIYDGENEPVEMKIELEDVASK
jgi:hypothetical protein